METHQEGMLGALTIYETSAERKQIIFPLCAMSMFGFPQTLLRGLSVRLSVGFGDSPRGDMGHPYKPLEKGGAEAKR
jgi:hypothetical protein